MLLKLDEKETFPQCMLIRKSSKISLIKCECYYILIDYRSLAEKELKWKAIHSVEEMCEDFWRWQQKNKNGYKTDLSL